MDTKEIPLDFSGHLNYNKTRLFNTEQFEYQTNDTRTVFMCRGYLIPKLKKGAGWTCEGKKGGGCMSDIDNQVGFMVHKLDMGVKRILDAKMKAAGYDEVTMMHGWILKYLYDHRGQEVYQRDIEKQFSIGRSTVTTIIQLMEKRDLVCRQSVEHDARLKRVMLTEKGFKHHDLVEENIYTIHQNVMSGISDEEKKVFLDIVQRMDRNLKEVRHKGGTVC